MVNQFKSARTVLLCTAVIAIVVGAATATHTTAQAQAQAIAPLLFHIGGRTFGDLWSAATPGAPLKQLTNWQYNYDSVLSPDGKYVAYLSAPRDLVQEITVNGSDIRIPPANVWVLDLTTGNATRVADQPPNASISTGGDVIRPRPAWSPDGKQLAWLEFTGFVDAKAHYQLVAYDVATQENVFTVKDAPGFTLPTADITGETVAWAATGIVYTIPGGTDPTNGHTIPAMLYLYDAHGGLVDSQALTDQTCGVVGWVTIDQPYAVLCSVINGQSIYEVFSPGDKSVKPLDSFGNLYLVNLVPTGKNAVHDPTPDGESHWRSDNDPDRFLADSIAISPDGSMFAVITSSKSYTVYDQNNIPTTVTLILDYGRQIDWIGWGATKFTIGKAM